MATATATATFTGAEDTVAVTYAGITSNPPKVFDGAVVTDSGPAPIISITGAPTNTGCTVATSARFTGTVNLLILD
jgi:hypothetical protein